MMESIRDKLQSNTAKHVGRALLAVTGLIGIAVGSYELSASVNNPQHHSVRATAIPQLDVMQNTWFRIFDDEKLPSAYLLAMSVGATALGAIGISKSIDELDARRSHEQDVPYADLLKNEIHIDWDSLIIDESASQLTYKGITYDS